MGKWQGDRPVLFEREEELAAIDAVIGDAMAGAGRLVVIEGPAGIGKSSLLSEGRRRAVDAGMTVLAARGTEMERAFSFGVVRQLFETRLARADAGERAGLLEGAAAHAGGLFEINRLAEREPAREDAAFALLHGLYWLTLNLAERRPLLISLDDVQWADGASLRWLGYLVRRVEGASVGVMATVRPVEEEASVLVELLGDPATTVVRPTPLSPVAVAELVRAGLSEAAEEFSLACHRTTGGNPLFLHELVRTLAAEDVSPSAGSVGVLERLAPDAVARSVKLRLSRLPPEAAALARAVAILGDGADGTAAAALAGIEPGALAPAAAVLGRVELLGQGPALRFVHPVVRNALYEMTSAHVRGQEHARAAAVLVSGGASVEQIASQILLAPTQSVEGAVGHLRKAARRAAAEGAAEGAARYLRRALDEPMEDQERGEVLLELAATEFALGAPTLVDELREAVALIADPERRVLAELELARALYWSGREEDALSTLEAALARREGDDDVRRHLQAEALANALRLPSQHEEARRRLAALDVESEEGSGARMLLGLQAYHDASRGQNRERAILRAEQALSAMLGDQQTLGYVGPLYALLFADRLDEALRFIDATIEHVRRRGAVFHFSGMSVMRTIFAYARGTLVDAEADARMALDALPHRGVLFMPHVYGWLAQVLVERGALDEAAKVLAGVGDVLGALPEDFAHVPLFRARGIVSAARGDHQSALADALAVGRILAAVGHDNPAVSYPGWRSQAALAHHARGADADAVALAREEVELAREWGAPRALGRALRTLGLVEGGAEGIDQIRQAVAVLENSPADLERAGALTDLGAALRRGNRRAEAREALRSALELAQRCGASRLARRAHEELIATGARPRRLVMSGVDSLTPSERRIAAMAAEGVTNKEIAQALFVTLRTVEMHLSNAFRKLDVSSRTQLPAALASSAAKPVAAGTN